MIGHSLGGAIAVRLAAETPDVAGFRHLDDREVARLDRIRVVRGRFEAPDGSTFERDVVRNQAVVAMVPVLGDGSSVLLVRQYRGPIDRYLLEIPAGLCDVDGEDPEATARRELVEEVGREADSLELIASYYPAAGFSDQFVRLYLATGLREVPADRQGVEEQDMTVEAFDLADLDEAAPAVASSAPAAGELGVQGFKRLLSREGFDLAGLGLTSENVLTRAYAGAQLQAEAAEARLQGAHRPFDGFPPDSHTPGAGPGGARPEAPPAVGGGDHPSTTVPGSGSTEHPVPTGAGIHDSQFPSTPQPHTILGPGDEMLPVVPEGAAGIPAQNGAGMAYEIPPGTEGLDPRVARVRVMDPVLSGRYPYPDGYVSDDK